MMAITLEQIEREEPRIYGIYAGSRSRDTLSSAAWLRDMHDIIFHFSNYRVAIAQLRLFQAMGSNRDACVVAVIRLDGLPEFIEES